MTFGTPSVPMNDNRELEGYHEDADQAQRHIVSQQTTLVHHQGPRSSNVGMPQSLLYLGNVGLIRSALSLLPLSWATPVPPDRVQTC